MADTYETSEINGPMADSHMKTMKWQQSHYMLDSGINSGVATQAQSVYNGELNEKYDEEYVESDKNEKKHTIPKLTEPSDSLNSAIVNLINYQDDADLAYTAIPQLTEMLNEDEKVVNDALAIIYRLSKQQASRHAMCNSIEMVSKIFHVMNVYPNNETIRLCVSTLFNISYHLKGMETIIRCNGVVVLVNLLDYTIDNIISYTITIIHNLLLKMNDVKPMIRVAGGINRMVNLLKSNNAKFLTITADCLRMLCYGHNESKTALSSVNGCSEFVRILMVSDYEKLLCNAARVLKVLSVDPKCKPEIVNSGGLDVLTHRLSHSNRRLVHNCLWTIRNLSDYITNICNVDNLIKTLVKMLLYKEYTVISCCAGILSNLSCNNCHNKELIIQQGGVEALSNLISFAEGKEEIIEPAICALRHLTARHQYADLAKDEVRKHSGLALITTLLGPPSSITLISAVIGLLRNLAFNNHNIIGLREQGCIPRLVQLLSRICKDLKRYHEGVRDMDIKEIINIGEGGCAAIHILAKDPHNRSLMISLDIVALMLQLLYYGPENVQKAASGVLSEIVLDPMGAKIISDEKGDIPLTQLLYSTNYKLSVYAAAVLVRLPYDQARDNVVPPVNTQTAEVVGSWYNNDL